MLSHISLVIPPSPQIRSTLTALRRQSAILMEQVPCNEQLTSALSQVEELQHELSNEREERAVRVTALEQTIQTLQEDTLAEEKKRVHSFF